VSVLVRETTAAPVTKLTVSGGADSLLPARQYAATARNLSRASAVLVILCRVRIGGRVLRLNSRATRARKDA
jgi:hypothetical protein